MLHSLERNAVATLLRRLPVPVTRRLQPWLRRRYSAQDGPTVRARLRLGHQLLLDLRSSVQLTAYFSGRFDDGLVRFARRLLDRPGALALDVGANIGFWTVPLAIQARATGGRVVAFEPIVTNHRRLAQNVRLNSVDDSVRLVPAALSDHRGSIEISLREEFAAGASTGNASVVIADGSDEGFAVEQAPTVTLDDVSGDLCGDVRVIKVDVEGHEDRVMLGGLETIGRQRPVIVAEWNPVYYARRRVDPTGVFEPVLAGLRYRTLRRVDAKWHVQRRFHSDKDLDNLVLAPRERAVEVGRLLDHTA